VRKWKINFLCSFSSNFLQKKSYFLCPTGKSEKQYEIGKRCLFINFPIYKACGGTMRHLVPSFDIWRLHQSFIPLFNFILFTHILLVLVLFCSSLFYKKISLQKAWHILFWSLLIPIKFLMFIFVICCLFIYYHFVAGEATTVFSKKWE